ncbi:hypothetical protein [Pseudanabaena phage PA-SR01]|nr:hypothetical protein [Pseudanabaena phage PA-SR01]
MPLQSPDFFLPTIANKANQLRKAFKSKSANVPSWGNQPINSSPLSLTRDQRAAIVQQSPPSLNRQEMIASASVGRGLAKQQAPRQPQRKLAPDEFLDSAGTVRKKVRAGAWRSQQAAQTAQYGGFSSSFVHFANF